MGIAAPLKIAEVIEANTTEFVAQCYELYHPPPFGSLVKTSTAPAVSATKIEIYGIVYNVTTSSIDPSRRPLARGKEESEEEDIYRTHPELSALFRTECNALVVGYSQTGEIHHYLPPQPARIHGFVYQCSDGEVAKFSQSLSWLSLLLAAQDRFPVPCEELLAASLCYASETHPDRRAFLIAAGKELARLLGTEVSRLGTILRRIPHE